MPEDKVVDFFGIWESCWMQVNNDVVVGERFHVDCHIKPIFAHTPNEQVPENNL